MERNRLHDFAGGARSLDLHSEGQMQSEVQADAAEHAPAPFPQNEYMAQNFKKWYISASSEWIKGSRET